MNIRHAILGSVAATALLSSAALAADLPSRKAPLEAPVAGFSWTGFYLGANVGYGFGNTDIGLNLGRIGSGSLSGIGANGFTGGLTAGFDWQFAQNFVVGLAVDGNLSDINTKLSAGGFNANAKFENSWAVRGRLGYLVSPATMLYGTAGWAQTSTKLSAPGFSASQNFNGTVVGAGIEHRLGGNWFANAEYLYTFYNSKSFFNGVLNVKPQTGVARVGLSYKFGNFGPAYPVFAAPGRSNWSGFFAGVQGGYSMANSELSAGPLSFRGLGSQGPFGGLIAGYDHQFAPNWLVGVEGDISAKDVKSTLKFNGATIATAKGDYDWGVRARLGYIATPGTMLFASAGYGQNHSKLSVPLFPAINTSWTAGGLQVGAGIETLLTSNLSLRAEYLHSFYGKKTLFNLVGVSTDEGKARLGLTYKFGGPSAIVAKY